MRAAGKKRKKVETPEEVVSEGTPSPKKKVKLVVDEPEKQDSKVELIVETDESTPGKEKKAKKKKKKRKSDQTSSSDVCEGS